MEKVSGDIKELFSFLGCMNVLNLPPSAILGHMETRTGIKSLTDLRSWGSNMYKVLVYPLSI